MQAYRAAILRFADDGSALYEKDGLLVVGPDAQGRQVVRAVGDYARLAADYAGVAVDAGGLPADDAADGLRRDAAIDGTLFSA